ncbi:phytanoyl-CoA dioxygenase family protein [Cribrihabitans neustonicus]|uniref:phytanoyl-CoA dioxygenase family protein n=1 Tax=Cribrihabitans neustonicus TaxID=1429085 RepID=UPI003B5CD522
MDQTVSPAAAGTDAAAAIDKIEKHGFARLPQVFSKDTVAEALERVQYWFDKTLNAQSDRMPRLNKAQPMVYNLQSKDIFFSKLILDTPVIEGVLKHFLNDKWFSSLPAEDPNYILRSFLARSSNHRMPMHIDSFVPYTGDFPFIMQCSILLEDQTKENGCTVIVPRSHKTGQYADPDSHETAVPLEAQAGDLIFWDSRIWHGAGENTSGGTRWSIIATFCRWWIKQAFDIPGNLPQEIYDQLSPRERAVMGYCSVPYDDETRGIDMKRNYGLLPEKVEDYRF